MIDVERVKQEASGKWEGIFQQLGIDVPENKKHGACPMCRAGKDRFRLFPDSMDGGWFCNQCDPQAGDGIALVQKVFGIGFIEAVKKVSEILGVVEMDFRPNTPKKDPSIYLNKVWNDSEPLTGDDPVSLYLKSRGITAIPENVRFCEKCYESDTKLLYPAMIAAIHNKKGVKIGIHRTYLEGTDKADIESPKKIMTPTESLDGSAIRLTSVYEIMGIAEGIETALSCTQLYDIPTWSCMTAGLMEKWTPPEGCKKVVIYADSDRSFAGQKAAYVLATKLYNKGLSVDIRMPPDKGQDFNDILIATLRPGAQDD